MNCSSHLTLQAYLYEYGVYNISVSRRAGSI
jgi:hypothetical protein